MNAKILTTLLLTMSASVFPAAAHDFKASDLHIVHPYALPSRPGITTGAVYFVGIRNGGKADDRLLSAATPVAGRVEIHRMQMLPGDVMEMREVPALDIPAGATMAMKRGAPDGYHLMLIDLKSPLKDGDRFPVTLTFERAGTHVVKVWVQNPRDPSGNASHKH